MTLGRGSTVLLPTNGGGTQSSSIDAPEPTLWVQPLSSTDSFVDGVGASDASGDFGVAVVCGWSLVKDLGNRSDWVGGTYVATSGVKADLPYSNGASSTIGVGVSKTGAFGSFTASGAVSRSSTGSIDFPTSTTYQHDYTFFRWGRFGYWCDTQPGCIKYAALARYWAGGSQVWNPGGAPSGSGPLSTQTGYSTTAKVAYTFTSARKLCGTHDVPGGIPRRLVAKS